jgi:hypothetical protein
MTAIGGFSSLALKKDDHSHYLKTIKAAALHANSLLNDAELLSRLDKEGGKLSIEPVDIKLLTAEVIDIFGLAARTKTEISIVNNTSALALGNNTAIRQILMNLCLTLSNITATTERSGSALKKRRTGSTYRLPTKARASPRRNCRECSISTIVLQEANMSMEPEWGSTS